MAAPDSQSERALGAGALARLVFAIASAVTALCVVTALDWQPLRGAALTRVLISTVTAAGAAWLSTRRSRIPFVLGCGVAVGVVDAMLVAWGLRSRSLAEALVLGVAFGLSGASGLLTFGRLGGSLGESRPSESEALVSASGWLLCVASACRFAPSELARHLAIGVAAASAPAMAFGLVRAARLRGIGPALHLLLRVFGAAVVWAGLLAGVGLVALVVGLTSRLHTMTSPHPCDLDRRYFNTAGVRIEPVDAYPLPGASEWRVHLAATFWEANVVACADGDRFIDSAELFPLLAARAPNRDARALAALHEWVTIAGGTAEPVLLDAPADGGAFPVTPPRIRAGVLEYWSDDTGVELAPRRFIHLVDLASGESSGATVDEIARAARGEETDVRVRLDIARLRGDAEALLALHDAGAERRALPLVLLRGLAGAALTGRLVVIAHAATDPVERAAAIGALAASTDDAARATARDLAKRETDPTATAILQRDSSLAQ
jgi:hypothetical protein